jgi:hypothetical protein
MAKLQNGIKSFFAISLLPLSLFPIYLVVGRIQSDYDSFSRQYLQRDALAPPKVDIPSYQRQRWQPLPSYRDAVPVLAYHGINDRSDYYSVSQETFATQMAMLEQADFHPISIAQYASFMQGDKTQMPERPVLITFDDSRLDSYRGADKVLAKHEFRATMFAIAGHVDKKNPFYSNWEELRGMAASGRWDIQEHSGVGHINVDYDAAGNQGPFYAYRRWSPGAGQESFGDYKARVTQDILWGKRLMAEQIPGYTPWAFAVPYGNYGQSKTNDRRIPRFLNSLLRENFQTVFLTTPAEFTSPADDRSTLGRFELHTDTTADRLYDQLRQRFQERSEALKQRAPSKQQASEPPIAGRERLNANQPAAKGS